MFRVGNMERRISSVEVVRDGLEHLLSKVGGGKLIEDIDKEFLESKYWDVVPWHTE